VAKSEENVKQCEVCGASIYPEMLKKGAADFLAGRLLCPHCLQEKRRIAAVNPAAAFAPDTPTVDDDEPIALAIEEEEDESSGTGTHIQAFGGGVAERTTYGTPAMGGELQRPLLRNSPNATRCRTFHCKLTDSSMAHMNQAINQWVDANEDIEIKFATSCIGAVEGKSTSDQHLIVTIYY